MADKRQFVSISGSASLTFTFVTGQSRYVEFIIIASHSTVPLFTFTVAHFLRFVMHVLKDHMNVNTFLLVIVWNAPISFCFYVYFFIDYSFYVLSKNVLCNI